VERRLRNAESYWLATTRPDGRAHVMPVWGVWLDGSVWFGTGQQSVKGRNLAANPNAAIHLDSSEDVVVLDGEVKRITDVDTARPVFDAYAAKYGMSSQEAGFDDPGSETGGALYRFRPRLAQAWLEGMMAESQSRWELG
jgi:PPOX class probable F420-dependent enzyme